MPFRCDAHANRLDDPGSHRRSHDKTDFMINNFDAGLLWDEYGICTNIVVGLTFPEDEDVNWQHFEPFTHSFSHANIHMLLAPDLLHQLIKGVFKDHLVTWVNSYLHLQHSKKWAQEIIEDIDHRYVQQCFAFLS